METSDPNNTWMPWSVPKRVPVDVPIGKQNPWVPWLLQYFLLVPYSFVIDTIRNQNFSTYLRSGRLLVSYPLPDRSGSGWALLFIVLFFLFNICKVFLSALLLLWS